MNLEMVKISLNEWLRLCGVICCVVCVGCSSVGDLKGSRRGLDAAGQRVVQNPLSAQLLDSSQLASVNSIAIAVPSVATSGAAGTLSADDAGQVIEQVARETMTLKIIAPPQGGRDGGKQGVLDGADAVLKTEILRFDQRQGSAIGGEPAVVSFRMNLESRGRRVPMWTAQYFLKQEAVSENLLRLGERVGPSGLGAGWSSAQEVFKNGVNAALSNLNAERERQFLVKDRARTYR